MQKSDFLFSIGELKEYLHEKKINLEKVKLPKEKLPKNFFLLIPKYYANLINWYDKKDPLRLMVLTNTLEKKIKPYELEDPIGDEMHSPVAGIIHRYPDRVLLNLTNICAVHCRFCFRKNLLAGKTADLKKSLEYIKNHPEIWEVIFSGGDPFMLKDNFLALVLKELKKIRHIKIIRFHTRTPAVYPERITEKFVKIIAKTQPCSIVFHINHPAEITESFQFCVKKLKKTGALLLSQTVLLKNINNNEEILKSLFRGLIEIGIKPYYLHHPDLAAGTDYFRVSVEEGKTLMKKLRGNISGTCLPEYVIDIPGGFGKIPVFWFEQTGPGLYKAENFKGTIREYRDYGQDMI